MNTKTYYQITESGKITGIFCTIIAASCFARDRASISKTAFSYELNSPAHVTLEPVNITNAEYKKRQAIAFAA
jgi:hypothetical protein